MSEFLKPAAQWFSQHVPLAVIILLFIFSIFFKIPKKEVNILGWIISKISNCIFGAIRRDIKDLKDDNAEKFEQLKTDTDNRLQLIEDQTKASFNEIVLTNNANCQKMQERLDKIERKQAESKAERIKVHIHNFANELYHGDKKSIEEFNSIFEEDDSYQSIIKQFGMSNNKYERAISFIHEKFDEAKHTGGFAEY